MNWWKDLKTKIKFQEPMESHTTFKIGGPAKYYAEPKDTRQLKLLLKSANRYNIPILVIGAGSNILVNDNGVKGIVLRLNSPVFKKVSLGHNRLSVASGVSLSRLLKIAQQQGLAGLEFLAGIPGTVGGALAMNAGIPKKNIGDLVEAASVMDYRGKIRTFPKEKIRFGYRTSNLSKYIILNARFKLIKEDKREIKNRIKQYLGYRRKTQGKSRASAGCIFKNHQGLSAGKLIDLCGLKGKRVRDASISDIHANFILNQGQAQAKDVLKLMDLARRKVKAKFHITLKPEIKIWQ